MKINTRGSITIEDNGDVTLDSWHVDVEGGSINEGIIAILVEGRELLNKEIKKLRNAKQKDV